MLNHIFNKNQVGFLSDTNKVIYESFSDEQEFPDFSQIVSILRARKFLLGYVPKYIVLRQEKTASSWLEWYCKHQVELFTAMKNHASKRLRTIILISDDGSEINVIFQISDVGFEGSTQYRIGVRKISNEFFACLEC